MFKGVLLSLFRNIMNRSHAQVKELDDKIYDNRSERGGRPNIDEIVKIKMLVLQSWYGLSDSNLERQANHRISFQKFLRFQKES